MTVPPPLVKGRQFFRIPKNPRREQKNFYNFCNIFQKSTVYIKERLFGTAKSVISALICFVLFTIERKYVKIKTNKEFL